MIYLVVFSLSAIIIAIFENKGKFLRKFGIVVGLLIPVLMATLRDRTVGIDVPTYMEPLFECASMSSWISDFIHNMHADSRIEYLDYGYALIGFFTTKITNGLWGIFLVNELLCVVPVILSVTNFNIYIKENNLQKRSVSYSIAMFIWMCIFFNNSLNQARQIICCCLLLWAFTKFIRRKYFVAALLFVLSITIHSSSIIFLYFVIIYLIAKSRHKWLKVSLIVALVIFLVFSIQIFYWLMGILNSLHLLPEKYYGEIFNVEYMERNLNLSWLFLAIAMLCITIYYWSFHRKETISQFFVFVSVSMMSLFNLSSLFSSFGRVQLYFIIYIIFILQLVCGTKETTIIGSPVISKTICIVVPILYWIVAVFLLDYTGTLQYSWIL